MNVCFSQQEGALPEKHVLYLMACLKCNRRSRKCKDVIKVIFPIWQPHTSTSTHQHTVITPNQGQLSHTVESRRSFFFSVLNLVVFQQPPAIMTAVTYIYPETNKEFSGIYFLYLRLNRFFSSLDLDVDLKHFQSKPVF